MGAKKNGYFVAILGHLIRQDGSIPSSVNGDMK